MYNNAFIHSLDGIFLKDKLKTIEGRSVVSSTRGFGRVREPIDYGGVLTCIKAYRTVYQNSQFYCMFP